MPEENVEVKARELGWSPKEEFRGDPEKWVEAEEFVRRGEEVMPLLKAANKRQAKQVETLEGKVTELTTALLESKESIAELRKFNSEAAIEKAKVREKELKAQLVTAKKEGETEDEVELTQQLADQRQAIKEAETAAKDKPKPNGKDESPTPDPTQTAEWQAWAKDNPWYGSDRIKTHLSMGIADKLRSEGSKLVGREFLDKVAEETEKFLEPNSRRAAPDKVEGGSGGDSGGGGKGFSELPPEARMACDELAERLVGKGKTFATKKEWREHYVKEYNKA